MGLLTQLYSLFPGRPRRPAASQHQVDTATHRLSLYQFAACPYCLKVRWAIQRLQLDIVLRDAANDPEHKQALLEGGGKLQTPCLRIEEEDGEIRWMYESADIIHYLKQRFT